MRNNDHTRRHTGSRGKKKKPVNPRVSPQRRVVPLLVNSIGDFVAVQSFIKSNRPTADSDVVGKIIVKLPSLDEALGKKKYRPRCLVRKGIVETSNPLGKETVHDVNILGTHKSRKGKTLKNNSKKTNNKNIELLEFCVDLSPEFFKEISLPMFGGNKLTKVAVGDVVKGFASSGVVTAKLQIGENNALPKHEKGSNPQVSRANNNRVSAMSKKATVGRRRTPRLNNWYPRDYEDRVYRKDGVGDGEISIEDLERYVNVVDKEIAEVLRSAHYYLTYFMNKKEDGVTDNDLSEVLGFILKATSSSRDNDENGKNSRKTSIARSMSENPEVLDVAIPVALQPRLFFSVLTNNVSEKIGAEKLVADRLSWCLENKDNVFESLACTINT